MPLLRAQKEILVKKLLGELKDSRISLIFAYQKLNAKANTDLRDRAFNEGGKIKMISNNLLKLVLKQLGNEGEIEIPQRQLAVAYGFNDEVVVAKLLTEFAKETNALEVLGGWIDGKLFTSEDIKTLSLLPTKATLQAQLVGRLGGLIHTLVYNLNFPLQQFAYVVSAVEQEKSKEGDK